MTTTCLKTVQTAKSNEKSISLFSTATLITTLSIAERGLGFFYRVVLSRLIGAEGLGLYQIALSLFAVFLTIGTGGIPVSVSRLLAKNNADCKMNKAPQVVGAGVFLCLLLTLPVAIILLPFAQKLPFLFSDERAVSVFKILLLGLCFSSVYAVIRGAFWGNKNFLTPSLLDIAEETVMVIAGVLLLKSVHSSLDGAQKAAWAATISYAFSFTASLIAFFFCGGKISRPKKQLKPLFNATLPITSVRVSGTLVNAAISVLLPVMLIRSGYNESESLRLFGVVTGMALPVIFIPATIIGSIALVLVPQLAEDFFKRNFSKLYQNITRGVFASFLIAFSLVPFFAVLGNDLGAIVFKEPLVGAYVQSGSLVLLPMSLTMISTGILNSLGFEKQTFYFYFVGASGMLFCVLFFPSLVGANAYVFGLFLSYILNAICNFSLLNKKCTGLFKGYFAPLLKKCILAVFTAIFVCIFGFICKSLLAYFLGTLLTALATGIFMLSLTLLLYFLFRLLPAKRQK